MSDSSTQTSDTSGKLIAASKMAGTCVYSKGGEKLGSIYNVMIDKTPGTARYAVMNFGGVFGIGEKYHPLPWKMLRYDSHLGGYVVDLDRTQMEGAPSYETADASMWGDETWGASERLLRLPNGT